MEYKITEKQCLDSIKPGFICSRCGGSLSALETVDNANDPTFWAGCISCSAFDNGVSKETYQIAKEMVENHNYRHYSHIYDNECDTQAVRKHNKQSQICGACGIVITVLGIQKRMIA